ncbi:unnamed protein product [Cylicocyclus nassatus]|uniref:Uncharacterized protein n=1 Tax=Cylicocyclus nassatus TaxID=53992 RepID=A0AA36DLJ4_CYLNA|nr:unnamed protein product [Cylicocyclus nassatus]
MRSGRNDMERGGNGFAGGRNIMDKKFGDRQNIGESLLFAAFLKMNFPSAFKRLGLEKKMERARKLDRW